MSLNTALSDGFKENFAALEESIIKINTLKKNKDVAAIKEIDSAHDRINNLKQTALFQNPTARGALLDLDNRLSYEEIHPFSEEADLKDKRATIDECWKNCLKSDARIVLSAKEKNLDTKSLEKMISKCLDIGDYANAIELTKLIRDQNIKFILADKIYDAVKDIDFKLAENAARIFPDTSLRNEKFAEVFGKLFKAELRSQDPQKLNTFVKDSVRILEQINNPNIKENLVSNLHKYLLANENRTPEMMFTVIKTIDDPDRKIAELRKLSSTQLNEPLKQEINKEIFNIIKTFEDPNKKIAELRKLSSAPLSESLSRDVIQELAVLKQTHGGQTSFVLNRIFEYAMKEENYALALAAATHITDQPDRHEALTNLLENLKKANVEHHYDLLIVKTLKEFPLNETLNHFEELIADPKLSAEAQNEMTSQLSELVKQNKAEPILVADENGFHTDLNTRLSKLAPALFEKAMERHDFENAYKFTDFGIPDCNLNIYKIKFKNLLLDSNLSGELFHKLEAEAFKCQTLGIHMPLYCIASIFSDKGNYKESVKYYNLITDPEMKKGTKAVIVTKWIWNEIKKSFEGALKVGMQRKEAIELWNRAKVFLNQFFDKTDDIADYLINYPIQARDFNESFRLCNFLNSESLSGCAPKLLSDALNNNSADTVFELLCSSNQIPTSKAYEYFKPAMLSIFNDPKSSPDLRKKIEIIAIRMAIEIQNTNFLDVLTESALANSALANNDFNGAIRIANLVASNPTLCQKIKNETLVKMLNTEHAKIETLTDQKAIEKASLEAWNRCKPLAMEMEQARNNPLPIITRMIMYLMATNAGDYSTSLMLLKKHGPTIDRNNSTILNALLKLTPKEKIEHREILLEILNRTVLTSEQQDTLLKELYSNPDRDYTLIAATIKSELINNQDGTVNHKRYLLWNQLATENRLAFEKELGASFRGKDIGFILAAIRFYAQTQDLDSAIRQLAQQDNAAILPKTLEEIIEAIEIEIARRIDQGIIENKTQLSNLINRISQTSLGTREDLRKLIPEMGDRLKTLFLQKNLKVSEETFNEKIEDMMLKDDPDFPIAFELFLKAGNIENAMVALSRLKEKHDVYLEKFIRFLIVKAKKNKQTAADVYAEVEKIRSQIPLPINRIPSKDLPIVKEKLEKAEKESFNTVPESEFQANTKTQADKVTTQQATAQANTKTQADKVTTQQASASEEPVRTNVISVASIVNENHAKWKSRIDNGFSSVEEWKKLGDEMNSQLMLAWARRAGLETKHRELIKAHDAARPK